MSNVSVERAIELAEIRDAEQTVVLVELSEVQVAALQELGLFEDRNQLAEAAFNSVLKGKVASVRDRAIKAKYLAESKNKPALAAECEQEIQRAIALYRMLS